MEKRFTVRDFILIVLLLVLIVSVWLAMKQYDRQWTQLQTINSRLEEQGKDILDLQRMISSGVALAAPTTNTGASGGTASTRPSDADPFARVRAATQKPGYAKGGLLVDAWK